MDGRKLIPGPASRNEICENLRDLEFLITPEPFLYNGEPLPVLQGNGLMLQVTRTRVVTISRPAGLVISATPLSHGESET